MITDLLNTIAAEILACDVTVAFQMACDRSLELDVVESRYDCTAISDMVIPVSKILVAFMSEIQNVQVKVTYSYHLNTTLRQRRTPQHTNCIVSRRNKSYQRLDMPLVTRVMTAIVEELTACHSPKSVRQVLSQFES